jgi:hypothetical protein
MKLSDRSVISEAYFRALLLSAWRGESWQRAKLFCPARVQDSNSSHFLWEKRRDASEEMLDLDRRLSLHSSTKQKDKHRPARELSPLAKQHNRDCAQCNIFMGEATQIRCPLILAAQRRMC